MTLKPTQDSAFRESDEPSWFADEQPRDTEQPKAPEPPAQAAEHQAEIDAPNSELTDAISQLQSSVQETCGALDSLRQSWERQSAETAERLARLDASLARMEETAAKAQSEEKSSDTDVTGRLDAVKASVDALTARNVDVMRQTMEFTNSSARRWTKELEEYRSLFRDSVFDDIWKDLGEIYINILKHLNRKNDPDLKREVEYCALEPLLEMLENYGVTLLTSEPGQKRSFKKTKSRNPQPTGDPEKDACVVRSIFPGFARESICLIPEVVESYVYQEGYQEAPQEEAESEPAPDKAQPMPDEAPAEETAKAPAAEEAAPADPAGEATADEPQPEAGSAEESAE